MTTGPWRRSRAWRDDANGSSRRISAWSPRPITAPSPMSYSMPLVWPGARRTTSRASAASWETGASEARWSPVASAGGPAWAAAVAVRWSVRRRSRSALRQTQSRKRYRTARKPNWSATETGSSDTSLHLEAHVDRPDVEMVAGGHRDRAAGSDRAAVDLDAVGGPEVRERPAVAAVGAQLCVAPRDVRVREDDVALAAAADDTAVRAERHALALGHQAGAPAALGAALGELLLRAGRRRVDHRVPVPRLLHGRRRGGSPCGRGRRPDEARLDAELAEVQRVVGAELDLRAAHEGQALAARVLEQVGRQLVGHVVLD